MLPAPRPARQRFAVAARMKACNAAPGDRAAHVLAGTVGQESVGFTGSHAVFASLQSRPYRPHAWIRCQFPHDLSAPLRCRKSNEVVRRRKCGPIRKEEIIRIARDPLHGRTAVHRFLRGPQVRWRPGWPRFVSGAGSRPSGGLPPRQTADSAQEGTVRRRMSLLNDRSRLNTAPSASGENPVLQSVAAWCNPMRGGRVDVTARRDRDRQQICPIPVRSLCGLHTRLRPAKRACPIFCV